MVHKNRHIRYAIKLYLAKFEKNALLFPPHVLIYIRFGGVAQLVERLNGIQEVRGSTPLISTT